MAAWDRGQIEIEHVYPQKPKAGEQAEDLDPYKHSVGDLTIWAPGDIRAAKNDRFAVKQPKYRASQSTMTRALGALPDWTHEQLTSRQNGPHRPRGAGFQRHRPDRDDPGRNAGHCSPR
jgi:hypothetical protein